MIIYILYFSTNKTRIKKNTPVYIINNFQQHNIFRLLLFVYFKREPRYIIYGSTCDNLIFSQRKTFHFVVANFPKPDDEKPRSLIAFLFSFGSGANFFPPTLATEQKMCVYTRVCANFEADPHYAYYLCTYRFFCT